MKIDIEFNDQAGSGIKKKFLFEVAKKTLVRKDYRFIENKNISISFAAVDEKEIKKINTIYRKKREVTDVLSFPEYKNKKQLDKAGDNIYLGEIILCYNYIERHTKQEKNNFKKELAKTISHGILHLLDINHSKKMFEIQDEVGNSF